MPAAPAGKFGVRLERDDPGLTEEMIGPKQTRKADAGSDVDNPLDARAGNPHTGKQTLLDKHLVGGIGIIRSGCRGTQLQLDVRPQGDAQVCLAPAYLPSEIGWNARWRERLEKTPQPRNGRRAGRRLQCGARNSGPWRFR